MKTIIVSVLALVSALSVVGTASAQQSKPKTVVCSTQVLEQGGSPTAKTVKVCVVR
jgi:hypothetical protein